MNRPSTPPEAEKLIRAALDVFVYAPIGLALEARDLIPKLAERGRNQVVLLRMFGQYALRRGQAEAERRIKVSRAAAPATSTSDEKAKDTASAQAQVGDDRDVEAVGEVLPDDAVEVVIDAAALAIPGYDTLSASQVVPRLDALSPEELEAVRQYELAHRGRRTILNRIAQLQA
ncbi:MAG TPA: hypothetical protein VF183_11715 [Acidimicrobiales bacterium]